MAAINSVGTLVPDLAMTTALASLVILFAMGQSALLRDADAGWHIRAGEQMIDSRSLPHTDPFSFSKPGQRWIAWEWGADLLVGAVHRTGRLRGVAFLYAMAIAATSWSWVKLNWAAGGNFLLTCLFAVPMLSTVNLHWLARPHIFSWLLILATVIWCERRSYVPPMLAFAIGVVWANVHGSFLLGPVIAVVYRRNMMAAAMLAGTFLNPNVWHLHQHVFAYLTDTALLDRVAEFQSFNFHGEGGTNVALALMIGIAGGMAALAGGRIDRFLLAVLFSFAALKSARMLPVAALVLLPLANGSIALILPRLNLDYFRKLRAIDRKCSGYALIPMAAALFFFSIHPAFSPAQFPVGAAQTVQTLSSNTRIFSSDKFGGFLIYTFSGERRVFFDGRSDFYGAEFMKSYSTMIQARPGWRKPFASWNFTHALLPLDAALTAALESDGWREIYRDRTAVLLEAKG